MYDTQSQNSVNPTRIEVERVKVFGAHAPKSTPFRVLPKMSGRQTGWKSVKILVID